MGRLASKPKENYQNVIQEHAREGWRFVQLLPSRPVNIRCGVLLRPCP
ncbi:DUF4177 domain-containing protein [Peribacillus frigoritolerans]|nr:DUF4177 domain-containing protein [Peribacillus frigoritolerans]MCK2003753.1 DUF4177 domain-containing protein [Peribacillus frigoritolerans]MEE3954659.1 DUF4177 domain-containing protein [Peribacillus frigoritolerans]